LAFNLFNKKYPAHEKVKNLEILRNSAHVSTVRAHPYRTIKHEEEPFMSLPEIIVVVEKFVHALAREIDLGPACIYELALEKIILCAG
jgi:hypothetical protein